ncbi:AsmA family protein [Brytella acorum]|uniref:AsmA family protein n=1 Tax=Brytella acorum TaxID=2959299 RepID=A0AA35VAI6_9PROT|nr:AsmA family protein [Brytella acorum]MDF3623832.1 AsmA family protein [Brytella acorum]CAI9120748.1 AsmA family protein [Brytella acorum]
MKKILAAVIGLIVLFMGASLVANVVVDRMALGEKIAAAVKRQTGHELGIGSFSVQIFPWPGFDARDVRLAGLPDGSGHPTSLFSARQVRGNIALFPLLWREVRLEHVVFSDGGLTLRRDASGLANWTLRPESQSHDASDAGARIRAVPTRWSVKVGSGSLSALEVNWRDAFAHSGGRFSIDRFELDGLMSRSPFVDLKAHRDATPFTISGHIGPIAALAGGAQPWAVSLAATLGRVDSTPDRMSFDGQIMNPESLGGVSGTTHVSLMHLTRLNQIFPSANLPSVDGIVGEIGFFNLSGKPPFWPLPHDRGINHVHLQIGALPSFRGVALSQVLVDAATLSSPLSMVAEVKTSGHAIHVQAVTGTLNQALDAWRSGFETALPIVIDAHQTDGDVVFSLRGEYRAQGSTFTISGKANALPLRAATLHEASLQARIDLPTRDSVNVTGLSFESHEATFSGHAAFGLSGEVGLDAAMDATSLDLDALKGLWDRVSAAPMPASPAATAPTSAVQPASQTETASGESRATHTLASVLKGRNGKVHLHIGALRFDGQDYADLLAEAVLVNGHLTIDPLSGHGASGSLIGKVDYDVSHDPADLKIRLAPFLLPATFAEQNLGYPLLLRGPLEVVGELNAQGNDRQALRQSLTGHLGLSMVGGSIDGRLLGGFLGHDAGALLKHGEISVRCLGMHMNIVSGVATLDTMGLQAGPLSTTGHGTYGVGDGRLDLHLVPRVGLGGAGASTPVLVTGSLQDPIVQQERGEDGRFSVVIGDSAPDVCGPALSAAREGMAGEAPKAEKAKGHGKVNDILHALGLFR